MDAAGHRPAGTGQGQRTGSSVAGGPRAGVIGLLLCSAAHGAPGRSASTRGAGGGDPVCPDPASEPPVAPDVPPASPSPGTAASSKPPSAPAWRTASLPAGLPVARTARYRQSPGPAAPEASPHASSNSQPPPRSPAGLCQPCSPFAAAAPPASLALRLGFHFHTAPLLAFPALSPPGRGRPDPPPLHACAWDFVSSPRGLVVGASCGCALPGDGTHHCTQPAHRGRGWHLHPFARACIFVGKPLSIYAACAARGPRGPMGMSRGQGSPAAWMVQASWRRRTGGS